MAFGKKIEQHKEEKAARKARERQKKFPRESILDERPMPVNRQGAWTPEEKAVVQLLVQDQPQPVSHEQTVQLASLLRRPLEVVQAQILRAREKLIDNAEFYVDSHRKGIELALSKGDPETALKHVEWAMLNLTHEGAKIIETIQATSSSSMPPIVVGVNLGGMNLKKEGS